MDNEPICCRNTSKACAEHGPCRVYRSDSSTCVCRIIAAGCSATEHDYDPIPDPVPPCPECADEVAALRAELRRYEFECSNQMAEVERMRPVVEAVMAWTEPINTTAGSDTLIRAIDAYREADRGE
jgi:hypothetical protein